MELGVFSLTDIYAGSTDTAASRTDDITAYGIAAERAGLDVFGIGEHHSRQFAVSSPAVNLAAIAQATSRIQLTTTATVLSVLDPVRTYQDFATLDMISHGRTEIYAGRSAFAEPFALFGENIGDLDSLFAEKLDLLIRLRGEQQVTWRGAHRPPLRDAAPNPPMREDLPIWVAVGGTPSSAQRAGQLGLPMALGLIGGTLDHAKRLVDTYRAAGRAAGHSDDMLKVGITSHFYVGESREAALDEFFPYYQRYLSPNTNGGRGWHVDRADMSNLASRRGALMVGGPREIAEKILDLHAELGVDRFLGQVDLGGLPRPLVLGSIRRLGEVVAPAVRQVIGS
ncbi:LLM class flavin-dependent oxidoreductase [Gordonia sp. HNM0687]|uniref:LLM class flavin-dependent oxidoreductase n=1 Tax=Gordonia mangrovi TaxID=2665643 RepID=A0A6L7GUF4_9ACTN|nr:LLM class flavin-dependent oxidoreductase [Gordonia mangrovi]MXP23530.1 LLM class flavin-dependent oxidoreductase [Gordonia mangrovi]UVF76575.1 LLM class flavin-dependent oxidoreductase [Gordonia mangrovi]